MPRARTDTERETVRQRLLDAGRARFQRHGLTRTTIGDLAKEAGIGKGTFYQFFDSKETLFLAVQEREEELFKARVTGELNGAASGAEAVRALLFTPAQRLDQHPFLRLLLDPTTVSALTLRVPAAVLERHRAEDRAFFEALIGSWKARGWLLETVDVARVFDVLASLFVLALNRELVGEDVVGRATEEFVEALVQRWCPS